MVSLFLPHGLFQKSFNRSNAIADNELQDIFTGTNFRRHFEVVNARHLSFTKDFAGIVFVNWALTTISRESIFATLKIFRGNLIAHLPQ